MKTSYLFVLSILLLGCKNIEPRKPINPKPSTTIFANTADDFKKLNQLEEAKILDFIKKDSSKTYTQSNQGFWYTYVNKVEDSLPTPKIGDVVTLTYDLRYLNDFIIYSKEELGIKNYKVDKEDFISGLQKGIKLMKIGETITFVLPSYNAFGLSGDGNKIGINESLKSTVTLININK